MQVEVSLLTLSLTMLLTDSQPMREVMLFPLLRREAAAGAAASGASEIEKK